MRGWHLERRISPKSREDRVGRCRDGVERRITKLDSDLIGPSSPTKSLFRRWTLRDIDLEGGYRARTQCVKIHQKTKN